MKTLAARVFLILLLATFAIQVLSFGGVMIGTAHAERAKLYDYLGHDVKLMRAILLDTAPAERAARMRLFQRGFYEPRLQAADSVNQAIPDTRIDEAIAPARRLLGPEVAVRAIVDAQDPDHLPGFEVPLDQTHKLLILFPTREPPYPAPPRGVIWLYLTFVTLGVMAVAWFAVRQVTRPLRLGAEAARTLAGNLDADPLAERGPAEVADVARAFNQMQRAIRRHLDERTQILASISHDLKTPLTRLRLRVAELDADERRAKLEADIDAMNTLVQEGLDYARSTQLREALVPVDLNPLVESIAERAGDLGQAHGAHRRAPHLRAFADLRSLGARGRQGVGRGGLDDGADRHAADRAGAAGHAGAGASEARLMPHDLAAGEICFLASPAPLAQQARLRARGYRQEFMLSRTEEAVKHQQDAVAALKGALDVLASRGKDVSELQSNVAVYSETFQKLAENQLGDGFMASPAITDSSLILRTRTALYRIAP